MHWGKYQRMRWNFLAVAMASCHRLAMFLLQKTTLQLRSRGNVDALCNTTSLWSLRESNNKFQRAWRWNPQALPVQASLCPVTLVRRKVSSILVCQNKPRCGLLKRALTQNKRRCCYLCEIIFILPIFGRYCAADCQVLSQKNLSVLGKIKLMCQI